MSAAILQDGKIYLGTSVKPEYLDLRLANRHGLITGATGTGKTVTLQVLAEGFSKAGVPVFAADIKGDLSGIAAAGTAKDFITARLEKIGLSEYANMAFPTVFWDVFGEQGHPIRATVADMGPLLLSRLLELNDVQEGVLNIVFRVAADEVAAGNTDFLLLDLKDLRSALNYVGSRSKELSIQYGNIAPASIGSIQRRLLVLEEQGADKFFGEPAVDINDLLRVGMDGRGIVNLMVADKLMERPRLYSTFLLWLLTRLWQTLPEVGDQPKPKLVFFFDEAHLLFDQAPKALLDRIEQVARLIRSKGVGVYFITQNPLDVPDTVSSQLGNRVQHALRAFTPREQKAVKAAATTFRKNPALDTEAAILELAVGEALVSVLENKGEPSIVQRTLIRPPEGQIGPITAEQRREMMSRSPVAGRYEQAVDRVSAHELLAKRAGEVAQKEAELQAGSGSDQGWGDWLAKQAFEKGPRGGKSMADKAVDYAKSSITRRIVGAIMKQIFGRTRLF
ncbi:MAG: helicase HerA-like domain-containing protein [Hyphomicrobiaceae bacterium]|nr:helicase HerA-like domain-containing protein [Hyphomicrobiaceae bacterium]